MNAGGGFFGHPLDRGQTHRVPGRVGSQLGLDCSKEDGFFFGTRIGQNREVLFGARAEVQQQRGIAAVVEDHVRVTAILPFEDAVRVIPVILQRFALDGKHRCAAGSDGRSRVILRREDVARRPAHFGTERGQRFDEHGGLDRHVQRTGDARALECLGRSEFFANRHQAGHFGFGDADFLAPPVGEAQVGNNVVVEFFSHSKTP